MAFETFIRPFGFGFAVVVALAFGRLLFNIKIGLIFMAVGGVLVAACFQFPNCSYQIRIYSVQLRRKRGGESSCGEGAQNLTLCSHI